MRKVLRDKDTESYWNKRWSGFKADDDQFHNMEIYPIKYVDKVMNRDKIALDIGCGMGRIVKHYHNQGYKISGCDYSEVAIKHLNTNSPKLDVCFGDIMSLPYKDEQFDVALAMGVYHCIEDLNAMEKGILETARCIKKGGYLVASMRADNLESRIIDFISNPFNKKGKKFHKWCFTQNEFKEILQRNSFEVEQCQLATNVPFLHKFSIFRKRKEINEGIARSEGFKLNFVGDALYGILKTVFPHSFGTTVVITAKKS